MNPAFNVQMSGLELFTKTAARHLFLNDRQTILTAADIRRGSWAAQLDSVINEVANSRDCGLIILSTMEAKRIKARK